MVYIVSYLVPITTTKILSPRARPTFKLRAEIITDRGFQECLSKSMQDWLEIKSRGLDVLRWWELVVKPGIRKLGIQRNKEINMEKQGHLNLLLIRQVYLATKLQQGNMDAWPSLRRVQIEIDTWYQQESEKILLQSRCTDISLNEKVSAYHHDLHKKHLKRSSILKLMTENGLIEGHKKCAEYLEQKDSDLLRTPAPNYESAQNLLLNEVMSCFTVKDNEILLKPLK